MNLDDVIYGRELDSRLSNGLQVRLLWNQANDRLCVVVLDTCSGSSFRIFVADNEQPLDVFNHPFAYAAHHGVDASAASRKLAQAAAA